MWPTLQALVKRGGTASNQEIAEAIVEIMAIPDEILEIPSWKGPEIVGDRLSSGVGEDSFERT